MTVTEQQARALTFLAASVRPTGASRWDEAGIYANIMKVADRSLAAVTIAVIQAAEDRNAQSPGVIPTTGPHWRNPETAPTPTRTPYDPANTCHICGKTKTRCVAFRGRDHEFLAVDRARSIASVPVPDDIRGQVGVRASGEDGDE